MNILNYAENNVQYYMDFSAADRFSEHELDLIWRYVMAEIMGPAGRYVVFEKTVTHLK